MNRREFNKAAGSILSSNATVDIWAAPAQASACVAPNFVRGRLQSYTSLETICRLWVAVAPAVTAAAAGGASFNARDNHWGGSFNAGIRALLH
jgi:hypothetical protein